MKYNETKDDIHCMGPPVEVNCCGNMLCEGEEGTCCRGVDYENLHVQLDCFNSDRVKVMEETHVVSIVWFLSELHSLAL